MRDTLDSLLSGITALGRWSTIALLTAALALPRPSHAEEPKKISADQCQTSRECFEEGRRLINQKDYTGGARLLERSLDINVDQFEQGILMYNIGSIYERAGDPDRAIPYFRSYLRQDIEALEIESRRRKKSLTIPDAQSVQQWIRGLEIYAAGKKAHTEGRFLEAVVSYSQAIQTEVSNDARLALQRDIALSYEMAGQLELAAKNYDGYLQVAGEASPDYAEIQGRVARVRERIASPPPPIRVEITPTPVIVPPTQQSTPNTEPSYLQRHPWSTIAGGVAVGLLGASAAFHFKAEGKLGTLERTCGNTRAGCSREEIDALAGDYKARSGLFWAGVGTAGVAGLLFALEPFGNKNLPKTSYRLAPFGMGAVLEGDL